MRIPADSVQYLVKKRMFHVIICFWTEWTSLSQAVIAGPVAKEIFFKMSVVQCLGEQKGTTFNKQSNGSHTLPLSHHGFIRALQ